VCVAGNWSCTEKKCEKCFDYPCDAGFRPVHDPSKKCRRNDKCRPCACVASNDEL
jgi:hypothetical protein